MIPLCHKVAVAVLDLTNTPTQNYLKQMFLSLLICSAQDRVHFFPVTPSDSPLPSFPVAHGGGGGVSRRPRELLLFPQSPSTSGGSSRGPGVEGTESEDGEGEVLEAEGPPQTAGRGDAETWWRLGRTAPSRMDAQPRRVAEGERFSLLLSPDFPASRDGRSGTVGAH